MDEKVIAFNYKRNKDGKNKLKKVLLECSSKILKECGECPEMISKICAELQISEKSFFSYVTDEPNANISFYDETLRLIEEIKGDK